jgi:hypothetical protein
MFENKELKRTFGHKSEKVRRCHKEELYNL